MSQRWALGEVTFLAAREALGSRSGATAQAKDGRPRPPAATAAGLQREELQFLRGCDSYRAREESQVAARQLGLRFLQACKRQSSRCRSLTSGFATATQGGDARPTMTKSPSSRPGEAIGAAIGRPPRGVATGHRRGHPGAAIQARPSARPGAAIGTATGVAWPPARPPFFRFVCVYVCVRAEAERLCPSAASSSLVGWAGQSAPFVPTPSQ